MKIKVKKINRVQDVETKYGKKQKTYFVTEDLEVMDTFAQVEEGQEYEGEVTDDQYGKHFSKARVGGGFAFKKANSDPDTMLIAYAKDVVCSFVEAGTVKGEKNAANQVRNFCQLFFGIYDRRKAGKAVVNNKDKEVQEGEGEPEEGRDMAEEAQAEEAHQKKMAEKDVNVDDIPF